MTDEMCALVEAFGYALDDLRWFTINAMKSAFLPFDERLAIIDDVVKPGYAALVGSARGSDREPRPVPAGQPERGPTNASRGDRDDPPAAGS